MTASDGDGLAGVVAEPLRLRPRPPAQWEALFAGIWPVFIGADAVSAMHLPRVRRLFGDYEVVLIRDGVLVAAAWGVPLAWAGSVQDLPGGYSDSLARAVTAHDGGIEVDTLVLCAARQHGLHRVVAPCGRR